MASEAVEFRWRLPLTAVVAVIGIVGALPGRSQSRAGAVAPVYEVMPARADRASSLGEASKLSYFDITVGELIEMAYGVKPYRLAGPDWVVNPFSSDKYDVVYKSGSPSSVEQLNQTLGLLLTGKFHLAFHREMREIPVLALVVGKGGPKLKPGDGGAMSMTPGADGRISYKNWSLADLVKILSIVPPVDRPVLDQTGLEGRYSFDAGDLIDLTAFQDQVGLRLESRNAPVEMFVIDRADKLP